jgi:hypothetical protein
MVISAARTCVERIEPSLVDFAKLKTVPLKRQLPALY